jgi:hypothetical protein
MTAKPVEFITAQSFELRICCCDEQYQRNDQVCQRSNRISYVPPHGLFAGTLFGLNLGHLFLDFTIGQKTVQEPAANKANCQNKKDHEGERQRYFPEENTYRNGGYILYNENDCKAGNDDQQSNL